MHSCYCSDIETTKEYIDKNGEKKTKIYGPKDWRLDTLIDNGSQEGIRQCCHQEVLMLRGEVVGKENEYGIDWPLYFDESNCFNPENENYDIICTRLKQDIMSSLSNIGNMIKVIDCIVEYRKTDNNIVCTIFAVYNGNEEALQYTIAISH